MKFTGKYLLLACAAAISISGCGGGDGDDKKGSGNLEATADPRIQELGVAGNWVSECHLDPADNKYTIERLNLSTSGVIVGGYTTYEDANCRTKMAKQDDQPPAGTFKLGPQFPTLSGIKVYEFDFVIGGDAVKNLIYIDGNSAYLGVDVDGDARPGRINLELRYSRETPVVTPPVAGPGTDPVKDIGGGGSGMDDASDGYSAIAGTWISQCTPFDYQGQQYHLKLKRSFNASNKMGLDMLVYTDASCQAKLEGISDTSRSGSYIVGPQFTDSSGITAYSIDMMYDNNEYHDIVGVSNGRAYFGDGPTVGSRPETLDLNVYYTR